MKLFVLVALFAASCSAAEWFDIAPKPAWRTGSLQTYQNPALGARHSWENKKSLLDISFETAFAVTAGMSGTRHGDLLDFANRADNVTDKYLSSTSIPTSPHDIVKTYTPVVLMMNEYFKLKGPSRGDGYELNVAASTGFSMQNIFLPRDALSVRLTQTSFQSWNFSLDKALNQHLRIVGSSPWQWLSDLEWARQQWPAGTYLGPLSPAGGRFAQELVNVGYSLEDASFLSYLLESSGLDFDSESADTFLNWLVNTLSGNGETLLEGDILEGNKSGLRSSALALTEYGLTYSFGIPDGILADFFTFGVTAKYMSLSRATSFELGTLSGNPNFNPFNQHGDSRVAFGLDLGLTFTPIPEYKLALSLSARNVNFPVFKWKDEVVRFSPQVRAGFSVAPFSDIIPIMVGFDIDLNRVESHVLPGYHTQQFRFQFELDPGLDPINFAIRFGAIQNIAEANEPLRAQAGLGLRLWWFSLDMMVDSSLDTISRSGQIFEGNILPTRLGFSGQASFKIEW